MASPIPCLPDSLVGSSCLDVEVIGGELIVSAPAATDTCDLNGYTCQVRTDSSRTRGMFAEAPGRSLFNTQTADIGGTDPQGVPFTFIQANQASQIAAMGSIGPSPQPLIASANFRPVRYEVKLDVTLRILYDAVSFPSIDVFWIDPLANPILTFNLQAAQGGAGIVGAIETLHCSYTWSDVVPAGQGHAWGVLVTVSSGSVISTASVPPVPRVLPGGRIEVTWDGWEIL